MEQLCVVSLAELCPGGMGVSGDMNGMADAHVMKDVEHKLQQTAAAAAAAGEGAAGGGRARANTAGTNAAYGITSSSSSGGGEYGTPRVFSLQKLVEVIHS